MNGNIETGPGVSLGNSERTVVVTVTYKDRIEFLEVLVQRVLQDDGVGCVYIVSNASTSNLKRLETEWGDKVRIIRLSSNTGSANGYGVGIQAALADGAEFVWLMDDDNAPCRGALNILHSHLRRLSAIVGKSKVAVLGFRPEHQVNFAAEMPISKILPPRSSYFGFHIKQIPNKIWKRTRWARPAGRAMHKTAILPFAPYGGLLAHCSLFEDIGIPESSLCLYADDTEYTWRISAGGGTILLVTDALLEDLEPSWNRKSGQSTVFERFLGQGTDFRAFYASRNQAWFDKNLWIKSPLTFALNRWIFLLILRYYARRMRLHGRLALLEEAIKDGECSKLGVHLKFPL
ncbi:glycosyltransferase [Paraburkholderia metrosideri]|uniref:Glycosyltransferase n=1 Tax=Paraburkholderia metrosideri TaxID=580937 RepID=A0ABW9DZB9_9BURK